MMTWLRSSILTATWVSMMSASMLCGQSSTNPETSPKSPEETGSVPVFTAGTQLVLVDVLALDPKSGLPINTLHRGDFRLSDNGHAVSLAAFDSGASYDTRPVALWLVVICNLPGHGPHSTFASGSFAGNESLLRPALDDLDKNDRVGVAHWCDDGAAQLDLRPTKDRDAAITTLAQVLKPVSKEVARLIDNRKGELTLQRLVRLIIDDAHQSNPQPLPVVVFLHSDHTGMPLPELNLIANEFLETSGIAFGMKDKDVEEPFKGTFSNGEQAAVLHYMCEAMGGQYYSVPKAMFSVALQSILLQLHFRYELGFKPAVLDGKRHELKVEFQGVASEKYKSAFLRYRREYIPRPN